jgi:hypothetical protein
MSDSNDTNPFGGTGDGAGEGPGGPTEPPRDSSPDARVLRRMVNEMASVGGPELDWDRLESKLFAALESPAVTASSSEVASSEVASSEVASSEVAGEAPLADDRSSAIPAVPSVERPSLVAIAPSRSRARVWAAALFAAAACFVGFFAWRATRDVDPPVAVVREIIDPTAIPQAPGLGAGVRQLGALEAGDVVEASVGPLAFGEKGSVEWTLTAGSRLVVKTPLRPGDAHVVELDSGSVRGRVFAASSVRFVVTAGETEVVSFSEGAVFTVTRSSKRVVVHMEEGVATLGRVGSTAEHTIEAPTHAALGLDGVSSFEILPRETVEASTTPRAPEPTPVSAPVEREGTSSVEEPRPRPVAARPAKPEEPEAGAPTDMAPASRIALSSATPAVLACMKAARAKQREDAAADPGLSVSVSSTLKVSIDAGGKIKGLTFSPPLAPSLQNCAVSLFAQTYDAGERTELVPVQLQ